MSVFNPNRFITGLSDMSYIVDGPIDPTPTLYKPQNLIEIRPLIVSGKEYWNTGTADTVDPDDQPTL